MNQKDCAIDLIIQLIENLDAASRTAVEVDKLLNNDWDNIGISKDEIKILREGIRPYVKVVKANSNRYTNYFDRIEYTWDIANRNRFS